MCGISGIISKYKNAIDESQLKVMNDSIIHRGPDAEGYYFYKNIGFGHRRLSILDLSEQGAQPMHYSNGYVITYNGEIYNYIELREELKTLGYKFESETDTEVLLASYQEWGNKCVDRLNGMWAFAILDKKKQVIFCSRDRFGIKPFFYHESEKHLFFGSEIKQLLTQIPSKKANRQVLFDFLYLGYHHHTNETFFEGIHSLAPGYNLVYDLQKNHFDIEQYYKLTIKKEYESLTFESAEKLLSKLLDEAINIRLRSDVKVGTCLSGGMDSSYIASVAAIGYSLKNKNQFTAITAKSIEKETDESHFAKIVVNHSNLDWKVTQPQKKDFLKVVDEVINVQEEPFGSPSIIMSYFVMKKAKEEGCIVLLDGQGGDETFLGYDRYYSAYLNQQKGIINKLKGFLEISRKSKLSLKEVILYNLYFNNVAVRAIRQRRRYRYIKKEYNPYLNKGLLTKLASVNKNVKDLQEFEITKAQLQKLLKFEDRNSMNFSIETRVPFVDYRVVELAYSLPFSYKMHEGWSKYILRKSAKDKLPDEIVWRRNKFGFEAPTKTWLSDKHTLLKKIKTSHFIKEFIDVNKIPDTIDEISLWKLYNIAVWSKKFEVQF